MMQATAPAAPAAPAAAPQPGQSAVPAQSPSLYVGDLDPKVTEAMLYEHFRVVGPIVSVRVCIDSQNHKSLGYGYVNYQNPADAERAIEQMNGIKLQDRPCRVARIQRDPTQRKSGVTNIVIKGLTNDLDAAALKDGFGKYGRIVSIKVPTNENSAIRGYAYLMFEKEESARQAVEEMNGASIGETTITVERYKNPQAVREEMIKKFTNLYVKNLAPGVTDEQLSKAFEGFGKITSAKVRLDETSNQSLGFGFVAFEEHESAVQASDAMNDKPHPLAAEGLNLCVKRFMDKKERLRARDQAYRERQAQYAKYPNLYIKNFDDTVTEQQLKDLFEQFGPTVSVRIQIDPFTKISRGFGFVSFKDHASAEKAVRDLAGSRVLGNRPLFVTYAMRRDARRQQFEDMQKKRTRNLGGMPPMGGPGIGMFQHQGNMRMMPMGPGMTMGGMPQGGMGMGGMNVGVNPTGMLMRGNMGMGAMGQPQMPPMMMPGMPQNMMMNSNMGNMQQRAPAIPSQPRPAAPPKPPVQSHPTGLDANYLAAMSPEQQKNVLGERLYTNIVKKHPKQAAKITGMLLEMDNAEILNLIDSPAQLDAKVEEAMEVLERHDSRM